MMHRVRKSGRDVTPPVAAMVAGGCLWQHHVGKSCVRVTFAPYASIDASLLFSSPRHADGCRWVHRGYKSDQLRKRKWMQRVDKSERSLTQLVGVRNGSTDLVMILQRFTDISTRQRRKYQRLNR